MKYGEDQGEHELSVLRRVRCGIKGFDISMFFGCTSEDVDRIRSALKEVRQNPETSFPDFFSPRACVELFRISSSEQGLRGGPAQMRQDGELKKTIAKDDASAAEEENCDVRVYCRNHPRHSYESLTACLRKVFEKHIDSLQEHGREYETTIFVIEYPECDLHGMLLPDSEVDYDGLAMGDLVPSYSPGQKGDLYRLSRDKENLKWMSSYADRVDYVVFVGVQCVEVINLHRIDLLIAFLPWKARFEEGCSINYARSMYLGSSPRP